MAELFVNTDGVKLNPNQLAIVRTYVQANFENFHTVEVANENGTWAILLDGVRAAAFSDAVAWSKKGETQVDTQPITTGMDIVTHSELAALEASLQTRMDQLKSDINPAQILEETRQALSQDASLYKSQMQAMVANAAATLSQDFSNRINQFRKQTLTWVSLGLGILLLIVVILGIAQLVHNQQSDQRIDKIDSQLSNDNAQLSQAAQFLNIVRELNTDTQETSDFSHYTVPADTTFVVMGDRIVIAVQYADGSKALLHSGSSYAMVMIPAGATIQWLMYMHDPSAYFAAGGVSDNSLPFLAAYVQSNHGKIIVQ